VIGDLTVALGANLRQVRRSRRLSLAQLAKASGVSRAMLSQIELGKSTPTVNVLWRITRALDIPFASLVEEPKAAQVLVMRAGGALRVTSPDGSVVSRTLFPARSPADLEVQEVRLNPRAVECPAERRPGGKMHLVVVEGTVALTVAGERHVLETGDAALFESEVAHQYANEGAVPARMVLLVGRVHGGGRGRR